MKAKAMGEFFHPVYPGHPLVLAIQAMEHFDSPDVALASTDHGWSEMVGSCAVSGAGDSAYNAAGLLRRLHEGKLKMSDAMIWAHGMWVLQVGPGSGNHEKQFEPGVRQANELRQRFYDAARRWGWS